MTQEQAILEHLKRGRIITPLDALGRYGCFRLAARIAELRYAGYDIKATMIKVGTKRVAAYRLA